jgi:Surface antigen variable number repeat
MNQHIIGVSSVRGDFVLKRLLWFVCFLLLAGVLDGQSCVPPVNFEPSIKALIHNVTFLNDGLFPPEKEDEIAKRLRNESVTSLVDKTMSDLADDAAERARRVYQDLGYFKVQVDGKAVPVATNPPQFDITIQIRFVGQQYRLGDLTIVKAAYFPTQKLRDLFPIQRGEIFSREKIEKGLEELRRSYRLEGYINFTAVPNTVFDDSNGNVLLNIDVDEGKQFRLSSVEVLGLDGEMKNRVLNAIEIRPGDVFSPELWQRLIVKFPDLSQYPAPAEVIKSDEREGLVYVFLDFRKHPNCRTQAKRNSPGNSAAFNFRIQTLARIV